MASGAPAPTAFVVNYASNSVTPVNLATRKAGKAIAVGADPTAIALTPNKDVDASKQPDIKP